MATQFFSHPALDPDQPIRVTLALRGAVQPEVEKVVRNAADIFSRFANLGAFGEVKRTTAAVVSIAGSQCHVDLHAVPKDPSLLGVLARMLLFVPEDKGIFVQGTPASNPARALEPLPGATSRVPRLRDPLGVACDLSPGLSWYCVELTKSAGWLDSDLARLSECVDVWMQVCRAAGLSDVSPTFEVVAGNVGMDPPQVGDDSWSGQIGATEINLAALSSLVNMLDYASGTGVGLDEITVT
jgi:hypothetical protein